MSDLDKSILYWVMKYNLNPADTGKLIDYIKIHWVISKKNLVKKYIESKKITNLPSLNILNFDKICKKMVDYEKIADEYYINIYELLDNKTELQELGLIKED